MANKFFDSLPGWVAPLVVDAFPRDDSPGYSESSVLIGSLNEFVQSKSGTAPYVELDFDYIPPSSSEQSLGEVTTGGFKMNKINRTCRRCSGFAGVYVNVKSHSNVTTRKFDFPLLAGEFGWVCLSTNRPGVTFEAPLSYGGQYIIDPKVARLVYQAKNNVIAKEGELNRVSSYCLKKFYAHLKEGVSIDVAFIPVWEIVSVTCAVSFAKTCSKRASEMTLPASYITYENRGYAGYYQINHSPIYVCSDNNSATEQPRLIWVQTETNLLD